MADEPIPEKERTLTPEELVRLKHSLGKSITWGRSDLNALEIEALTTLDKNDYTEVHEDYAKWHPSAWNTFALIGVLITCIIAYFLVPNNWVRIMAVAIGITCFVAVGKRQGHLKGYIEGYEAGHEAGIYKILGIKNEEVGDIAQMATKMKIDEMLVDRMNERKTKESK